MSLFGLPDNTISIFESRTLGWRSFLFRFLRGFLHGVLASGFAIEKVSPFSQSLELGLFVYLLVYFSHRGLNPELVLAKHTLYPTVIPQVLEGSLCFKISSHCTFISFHLCCCVGSASSGEGYGIHYVALAGLHLIM